LKKNLLRSASSQCINSSSSEPSKNEVPAIVGGVIGSVVGVALIIAIVLIWTVPRCSQTKENLKSCWTNLTSKNRKNSRKPSRPDSIDNRNARQEAVSKIVATGDTFQKENN